MVETFLTRAGLVLGTAYSEVFMTYKRLTSLAEIKAAWAKAKPAERRQAQDFLQANAARDAGRSRVWFLVQLQHHDNGAKLLAAGYSYGEPGTGAGLSLAAFRVLLGVKAEPAVPKVPPTQRTGPLKPSRALPGRGQAKPRRGR